MVVDPTPQTYGILTWLVPSLAMIFVLPRIARWGAWVAAAVRDGVRTTLSV